jgi:heme oxygenase
MLTHQLREETKRAHADLEKHLLTHIRRVDTTTGYVQLLAMLYGYYQAVEERLQPFLAAAQFPDHERRLKAAHIIDDMQQFDNRVAMPRLCSHVPEINSYAKAIGALYVIEGSTLGGKIIAGMIAKQLNTAEEKGGFSFFNCYGNDTHVMWNSFKQVVDQSFAIQQQEEIITAANETFITFKRWIDQYEANQL